MTPSVPSSFTLQQSYQILNYTRGLYPAIILGVFLVCFVTFGVVNSPDDGDKVTIHSMRGPGGRPLPTRRKSNNQIKEAVATRDFSPRAKWTFAVMTSFIIMAFVVNGMATLVQTISLREDEWWPGQSAIVSMAVTKNHINMLTSSGFHRWFLLCLDNRLLFHC